MSLVEWVIGTRRVQGPVGTDAWELFRKSDNLGDDVVAVLAGFCLKSLTEPLLSPCELRAVDLKGSLGHKVYRRTLCFLLEIAARKVAPELTLRIGHSLGDGYFFQAEGGRVTETTAHNLQLEMEDLVQKDEEIRLVRLPHSHALEIFTSQRQEDVALLISQKNDSEVPAYRCADFYELAHFPLAHRTGLMSVFGIEPYTGGLLLRFPEKTWPLVQKTLMNKPLLDAVFQEYRHWGSILGVPTVARLNRLAQTKEIQEFIQVSETLQEKKLGYLADRISSNPNIKLVLMAGPSSAGKTTFTKKLAIHLKTVGLVPHIIGLDDYFVTREETPLGADGHPDFEALQALDVPLLNAHLEQLLEGKSVDIPIFDFKMGRRKLETRPLSLGPKDILLMEGIHGLNDDLIPSVSRSRKFKIYLNALTQLSLDNRFRISTTDNRLIRRLVRDHQFRGYSALYTLRMWPSVRRGEAYNIFPFQDNADSVFNSALDYELSVLRNYAIPLLKQVSPAEPQSTHAGRLIDFLENFTPIQPHFVPAYSILREFIGQSGFKY